MIWNLPHSELKLEEKMRVNLLFQVAEGLFPDLLAGSVFSEENRVLAKDLGLLDANDAYDSTQLELLKFYSLTTTWNRISC